MKKCFSILLSLVMMFSVMSVSVFATEPSSDTVLGDIANTGETHVHEDGTVHEGAEHADGEEGTVDESVIPVEEDVGYKTAKVVEAGEVKEQSYYEMYTIKVQNVKILMLDGKNAGKEFDTVYYISQDYNGMFEAHPLKVGDKVYAGVEEQTNEETGETITTAYVIQKMRDMNLLVAGLIIAIVLLVLGTMSGVKTLGLAIVNTVVAIAVVFGLYLNGVSAILSLLALVVPIIIADVMIINGFKKESWVAILAVFISTIITIGVITLLNNNLSIIGMTEYGSYLSGVNTELLTFNYLDLLVAGAMLMTLGVTIDMGIRSVRKGSRGKSFGVTLKEVAKKLPNKLNSVFLVWLGGFVTVFAVFVLYARPLLEIINVETIIIEFVKIMVVFLNAIIVMPIGILLSKELLKKRELAQAKDEEVEHQQ